MISIKTIKLIVLHFPPELVAQFSLVRQASVAMGLPPIEVKGFEADDLIATYCVEAKTIGMPIMIVSSDKDLMQLIAPGIGMYDPVRSRKISLSDVEKKFGGDSRQNCRCSIFGR